MWLNSAGTQTSFRSSLPVRTHWDPLGLSGTFWDPVGSVATCRDLSGPSRTCWDPVRPVGTEWDLLGPFQFCIHVLTCWPESCDFVLIDLYLFVCVCASAIHHAGERPVQWFLGVSSLCIRGAGLWLVTGAEEGLHHSEVQRGSMASPSSCVQQPGGAA